MSAKTGDKARFNRDRKKKILRNKRTRELQKKLSLKDKSASAASVQS